MGLGLGKGMGLVADRMAIQKRSRKSDMNRMCREEKSCSERCNSVELQNIILRLTLNRRRNTQTSGI